MDELVQRGDDLSLLVTHLRQLEDHRRNKNVLADGNQCMTRSGNKYDHSALALLIEIPFRQGIRWRERRRLLEGVGDAR